MDKPHQGMSPHGTLTCHIAFIFTSTYFTNNFVGESEVKRSSRTLLDIFIINKKEHVLWLQSTHRIILAFLAPFTQSNGLWTWKYSLTLYRKSLPTPGLYCPFPLPNFWKVYYTSETELFQQMNNRHKWVFLKNHLFMCRFSRGIFSNYTFSPYRLSRKKSQKIS